MGGGRKGRKRRTFVMATIVAVLVGVVLITLGRVSSYSSAVYIPGHRSTASSTASTTSTFKTDPSARLTLLDTSKGSPDSPITIIEYSDFQCAHCQEFALTLEAQLETDYIDTGKVRMIYKFIAGFGEESRRANEAAASAAEQGQFWPYYFLLMQLRASPTVDDLPVGKLQGLAKQLGLNMDLFNDSFLSGKYAGLVDKDDMEGRARGVTGTPTFFINGIKMEGATSLQDFQNIIDPQLHRLEP
jgi:protein-disulfide isomerase